jgi:hypothetical protein
VLPASPRARRERELPITFPATTGEQCDTLKATVRVFVSADRTVALTWDAMDINRRHALACMGRSKDQLQWRLNDAWYERLTDKVPSPALRRHDAFFNACELLLDPEAALQALRHVERAVQDASGR